MKMEKLDARKQSREEHYVRRQQVIKLREEGVRVMQIVKRTGLSWAAVNSAIKEYEAGGEAALRPAARGRKSGTGRALTADQESEIRQCIRRRRPLFYRLKKSLWDRESLRQLVAQKYGIDLSERVVGNYLNRWGLAPKNAKLRELDRGSKVIRQWLERNYAEVAQKAQVESAEIYWLRKPVMIDAEAWSPSIMSKGADAEMPIPSKKKLSMVSVATNQGKLLWAISNGPFNLERQIKFMEALIEDAKKNRKTMVFLIRSDWQPYSSPDFMRWIGAKTNQIKIFPESKN